MFKACLKKEFLEEVRTKRFLRYILIACGMVFLSVFIMGIMAVVAKFDIPFEAEDQEIMSSLMTMFDPTYQNFAMYFGTFIMTYFTIIYIIMLMGVVSKDISQNKWILPISAGIMPETMISAKLIVKTLSIVIAEVLAIIIHFVCAISMFESTEIFGIGHLFVVYGGIVLFTIFMAVFTMAINAISKKPWVSAVTAICTLIIGTIILESIVVGGTPIIAFTPFLFYELSINPIIELKAVHYIVSLSLWVLFVVGLSFGAIFSTKIKPKKDK